MKSVGFPSRIGNKNVWAVARLQGVSLGEKTSLSKMYSAFGWRSAPGHDELRVTAALAGAAVLFMALCLAE